MSFVKHQITLGAQHKQPLHTYKTCSKCEQQRIPEGGIELSPGKWICAACWAKRASRKYKQ